MGWLRRHRVLLPGVSVLARQVSEARKVAEKLRATAADALRPLRDPEASELDEDDDGGQE
ncbi:hypothetical protein ACH4TE_06970 [Streptomyces sioyaensis]|uniref:hypothetical protein n=1 Tax=Streptomyces sioyaensis TaxID=67364 RepID=UPI0037A1BF68